MSIYTKVCRHNGQLDELMKQELAKQFKKEYDSVFEQMRKVKTTLSDQGTQILELKTTSDLQSVLTQTKGDDEALHRKNRELREIVDQKEATLTKQSKNINDIEQYTRRSSIRMYGLQDENIFESANETALLVTSL